MAACPIARNESLRPSGQLGRALAERPGRWANASKEVYMTTRRTLFIAAPAFAATLAAGESARAQNAPDSSKTADFLFVQTAKGMTSVP
jgi:hypothetical protein